MLGAPRRSLLCVCARALQAITEGLRGMPKFQEHSSRYSLHMALTQELMTKYNHMSLEQVQA